MAIVVVIVEVRRVRYVVVVVVRRVDLRQELCDVYFVRHAGCGRGDIWARPGLVLVVVVLDDYGVVVVFFCS